MMHASPVQPDSCICGHILLQTAYLLIRCSEAQSFAENSGDANTRK